jgi:serine phosphatase RsbU (regulator of sigma subunit)
VLQKDRQYIGLEAFIDLLSGNTTPKGVDHILEAVIGRQASVTASDDMSLLMVQLD